MLLTLNVNNQHVNYYLRIDYLIDYKRSEKIVPSLNPAGGGILNARSGREAEYRRKEIPTCRTL